MDTTTGDSKSNSLGLQFEKPPAEESPAASSIIEQEANPSLDAGSATVAGSSNAEEIQVASQKDKKRAYVNPDRVMTGGTQRDKLSSEELADRMQRIREQNEKIKQRRLAVQADEDAFNASRETERLNQAKNRKVQEAVNRDREQNARRKMEKIENREWDNGKQGKGHTQRAQAAEGSQAPTDASSTAVSKGDSSTRPASETNTTSHTRGRGRSGRGRGGQSRGMARPSNDDGAAVAVSPEQ